MRGTPRYEAGSRFKYTPDYIDFTYENLVNAIGEAIDKQAQEDGEQLSELALGCARKKIADLQRALKGSVRDHQRMMLRHQLNHVEMLGSEIKQLDMDIKKNRVCS